MHFRATVESLVILLLIALAVVVLYLLAKRKLESNLPLVFYCAVITFLNVTRRPVDTPLVMCGLIATLALRFEFMNRPVTNLVRLAAVAAIAGIVLQFAGEAFGLDY